MRIILFLILFAGAVNAQDTTKTDTIPVYVIFQPYPGSALTGKDAYLIKGEYWYRSVAALNKGKWLPFRKGWRIVHVKSERP